MMVLSQIKRAPNIMLFHYTLHPPTYKICCIKCKCQIRSTQIFHFGSLITIMVVLAIDLGRETNQKIRENFRRIYILRCLLVRVALMKDLFFTGKIEQILIGLQSCNPKVNTTTINTFHLSIKSQTKKRKMSIVIAQIHQTHHGYIFTVMKSIQYKVLRGTAKLICHDIESLRPLINYQGNSQMILSCFRFKEARKRKERIWSGLNVIYFWC